MILVTLYLTELAYYFLALSLMVRRVLFGDTMAEKSEPKKKQWALDSDLAAMARIDEIMAPLTEKDRMSVMDWITHKYGEQPAEPRTN